MIFRRIILPISHYFFPLIALHILQDGFFILPLFIHAGVTPNFHGGQLGLVEGQICCTVMARLDYLVLFEVCERVALRIRISNFIISIVNFKRRRLLPRDFSFIFIHKICRILIMIPDILVLVWAPVKFCELIIHNKRVVRLAIFKLFLDLVTL